MKPKNSFQFSISKVINAPLPFVYGWCTDYREDDYKISGQKRRIKILERTKRRFIMSIRDRRGVKVGSAARIVSLKPPNGWHLDWVGDENDEQGDYHLSRLGPRRTRLNATFRVRSKTVDAPKRPLMLRNVNAAWERYVNALEKDYRKQMR